MGKSNQYLSTNSDLRSGHTYQVEELKSQVEKQQEHVQWLENVTAKELWIADLDALIEVNASR